MNEFKLIKTMPNTNDFHLFETVVKQLYPTNSPRFMLGHDPQLAYLEGCYVLEKKGKPVGRFAFYENPLLTLNHEKAACIGSYACVDDKMVSDFLINEAKKLAKQKGYTQLIGPMEGSTWNNHRFSTHNEQSIFFMEPFHHLYYNDQFSCSGFQQIANYESRLVNQISFDRTKHDFLEQQLLEKGATIRCIDMQNLKAELTKMGAFCNDAFKDNFCFTPIEVAVFVQKYERLTNLIIPELIWLIEDRLGQLQALSFSVKDYADTTNKRFIIKTLARRKESDFKGIAAFLLEKTYKHAVELGFEKAIHAFMKTDNFSNQLSDNLAGKPYKSYALYGIQL